MSFLDRVDASNDVIQAAEVAVVFATAVVFTVTIRSTLRFLTRRAVRQALKGRGWWKLRLPRIDDGASAELRRVQRADAAAHMMSRLLSLVVWAVAVLVITRILGVDPLVLISSAGFVGAGIAIGGQALIKDWLTGLLVLLEDRYAIGDQVRFTVGGQETEGTVETFGGAGVRLRLLSGATWHAGHGTIESVTNLSQQLITHTVEIPGHVWAELDETMIGPELNAASHDLGLTDVLLLADIEAEPSQDGSTTVTFQASRPLSERQRRIVGRRITDGPRRDGTDDAVSD
ncbi:MAG: mechanosensitive ion channel [Acidimicrobiales bacterium]